MINKPIYCTHKPKNIIQCIVFVFLLGIKYLLNIDPNFTKMNTNNKFSRNKKVKQHMISLRLDSIELERLNHIELASRLSKSQIFRASLYCYIKKEFPNLI